MAEKYDKLDRMRADIQKDREKVSELLDRIKQKEAKLKEAEASQIVADVGALNMTPEQLGEFLELIKSGRLSTVVNANSGTTTTATASTYGSYGKDDDLSDDENEDMEDIDDEN